jgi:hypothetical protein
MPINPNIYPSEQTLSYRLVTKLLSVGLGDLNNAPAAKLFACLDAEIAAWQKQPQKRQGLHSNAFTLENPTPADYKRERVLRGTQAEAAKQLGVLRPTLARRETTGKITREAWLALCALPLKKTAK